MQAIGFVRLVLELPGDAAHILGAVGMGHQHGVGGVDDDQVFHAQGRHQTAFALDEVVLAVDEQGLAGGAVVLRVGGHQAGDGAPGADIAPIECGRDHHDIGGALHQGIVDGDVWHVGEMRRGQLLLQAP